MPRSQDKRPQRVGQMLQQEISRLLTSGLHDPRIGFVTITEVRVAGDLRHARIYISAYTEKAEREECQHSLLCSPLELGEISPRDTSYFPDEPLGDNKYRSCNRDVTEEDNKALEPIRVAVKDAFDSIFVRTDPPDV